MIEAARSPWHIALLAAHILAVGRESLGGLHLRARSGPVRDAWIDHVKALLSPGVAWRRITPTVPAARLIGGLDVARTLESGRPRLERGVLAAADGGILVLSMAERSTAGFAATIGCAMDNGGLHIERSGLSLYQPTRFCLLCLDEGADEEERLSPILADRLALNVDLSAVSWPEAQRGAAEPAEKGADGWRGVVLPDTIAHMLEETVRICGYGSMRTSLWIGRVARIIAALDGCDMVSPDHAGLAFQLVCPVRPAPPETQAADQPQTPADTPDTDGAAEPAPADDPQSNQRDGPVLDDILVAAQNGVLPALAHRQHWRAPRLSAAQRQSGKSGAAVTSGCRGRPVGVSATPPSHGARLDVPATLRSAAPWQVVRRREREAAGRPRSGPIDLRKSDFRYRRLQDRTETTAILSVDASGSTALERLGEAKGATEMLLADCYVRRERVALIAFRGQGAELLLAPTRSLVRAKRSLASMVGGGGTPLAAGLTKALQTALLTLRHGQKPLVVLLTDGSANIALDGSGGRPAAQRDAEAVASQFTHHRVPAMVIDIARRAKPATRDLADRMNADYYALPRADAHSVSALVHSHLRER